MKQANGGQHEHAYAIMPSRWRAVLDRDPCYDPNLGGESTVRQIPLAVPPRMPFGSRGDWRDPNTTISRTGLMP